MYCTVTAMGKDSFELDMHTYHNYELRQLQLEMYMYTYQAMSWDSFSLRCTPTTAMS
jgi:hypothetical protein